MKNLKLREWTYRGEKLAGLHVMARRAVALPVLYLGRGVVFLAALLGWGLADAQDAWKRMP